MKYNKSRQGGRSKNNKKAFYEKILSLEFKDDQIHISLSTDSGATYRYKFDTQHFISSSNRNLLGVHNSKGRRIGFFFHNKSFGILTLGSYKYKITKDYKGYNITPDEEIKRTYKTKKEKTLHNKELANNKVTNFNFHEDNIKFQIGQLLERNNIKFLLEARYKNCRFDILIFKDDKPVGIIEVKKKATSLSTLQWSNKPLDESDIYKYKLTAQAVKYVQTGLPVFFLRGGEYKYLAFRFARELTKQSL